MMTDAEASRWLKDARACLNSARWAYQAPDYRATVQNAQLAVELAAKAVIAYFEEPLWEHDPSPQLRRILDKLDEVIGPGLEADTVEALYLLAGDAKEVAPWHGRSTYGQADEAGVWVPAVDLCTRRIAESLLERAERALPAAEVFLEQAERLRDKEAPEG
nr:HEPN domain-containing protein [Anaerolineae bacterium]